MFKFYLVDVFCFDAKLFLLPFIRTYYNFKMMRFFVGGYNSFVLFCRFFIKKLQNGNGSFVKMNQVLL